jgi:hypothetical protein
MAPFGRKLLAETEGTFMQEPSSPPAQRDPVLPQVAIEQYKAKLSDLGNLGARQTAMTTYYVSIVAALLGVLAFKDRPLAAIDPFVIVMIGVGGMLVSVLWFFGVTFFRQLFRAKLHALERIEEALPYQTFKCEYQQMTTAGSGRWLWLEQFVPAVFAALFMFLLAARFL